MSVCTLMNGDTRTRTWGREWCGIATGTPAPAVALPVHEARFALAQGVCTPGPEHVEDATRVGDPPACPHMGTRTPV